MIVLSELAELLALSGEWTGTSSLWLDPAGPADVSQSIAEVSTILKQRFVRFDYAWAADKEHQEGSLVIGFHSKRKMVHAVWLDTWHVGDGWLVFQGTVEGGVVNVYGQYEVGKGPDWRWRITIDPKDKESFKMLMYNITPWGKEGLAVDAAYTRVR